MLEKDEGVMAPSQILVGIETKLSWVMTLVWHPFVLIFAVVQLSIAEYVIYGWKMTLSVTEPKPMSSPINYPA